MSDNPYLVVPEAPSSRSHATTYAVLGLVALLGVGGVWWNSAARRYPVADLKRLESHILQPRLKNGKLNLPVQPTKRHGKVILIIPSVWSADRSPRLHPDFFSVKDELRARTAAEAETVVFCKDRKAIWRSQYGTQTAAQKFDSMSGQGRKLSNVRQYEVPLQASEVWAFRPNGDYLGYADLVEPPPDEIKIRNGEARTTSEKELIRAWVFRIPDADE